MMHTRMRSIVIEKYQFAVPATRRTLIASKTIVNENR